MSVEGIPQNDRVFAIRASGDNRHLDAADFRAFTFGNPVALWAGTNPYFVAGTVIADAVTASA